MSQNKMPTPPNTCTVEDMIARRVAQGRGPALAQARERRRAGQNGTLAGIAVVFQGLDSRIAGSRAVGQRYTPAGAEYDSASPAQRMAMTWPASVLARIARGS